MIQVGAFPGIRRPSRSEASVPDLLRRADIAMDHAKSGRVARPVWFDGGMERALVAHSEIEQGIRFGLEHDQFVPYFEPQVDLATGEIIGFEVLARWDHPLSGIIGPDVFIPVAEEMARSGDCRNRSSRGAAKAADWDPSIKLSVNISPTNWPTAGSPRGSSACSTETGFPAERLVVEITESSLFADLDLARSIVTSLKNQGIRLALDDFGTGFSSLSHLRSLPFDVIKIDRSFVATIDQRPRKRRDRPRGDHAGQAIGVPVTVEGIEDAETHDARARLWLRSRPGLVFRQADGGRQSRAIAAPAAPVGACRAARTPRLAAQSAADRVSSRHGTGGTTCAPRSR